jgi:L-alanine-DL-glutamate epimerase-like enolase superfamily enzyme
MDYQAHIRFDEEIGFEIIPYRIQFKKPARTSRDTLLEREIFFLKLFYKKNKNQYGLGECGPIYGLSPELKENVLRDLTNSAKSLQSELQLDFASINSPAIRFCLEMACMDLLRGGKRMFVSNLSKNPIPINGLVWMNSVEVMKNEGLDKILSGYTTVKFKVGAERFEDEIEMLKYVRAAHPENRITIRLDANGAFSEKDVMDKLEALSAFQIHSIEQPVKQGQWDLMKEVILHSPIPIALDEELIGIQTFEEKLQLIELLKPAYIVLKPMLHGGIGGCMEWIKVIEDTNTRYWVTSMLETSVGLNAIAQWVSTLNPLMPQGLGTGGLYTNNLPAAWETKEGFLYFRDLDSLAGFSFEA